ncbi:MAG: hypothetical protein ABI340_07475 [Nitrososphaera sp.]|jgi:predicted membrane chloride channel (bestrophin family)
MKAPPSKTKLRIITIMFLVAGIWGIFMGLFVFEKPNFILTSLGIVNISLAIYLGFRLLKKDNTNRRK